MSWSASSVVLSTTSSDSASIIEFSSEVSFLKGNGFSSVWNNKNFSESLKNSRTWELTLDIDVFTFEVNRTNKNWMNANPIEIVSAKLIIKAYL